MQEKGAAMAVRGIAFLLTGLLLGGCMQGTLEQASDANLTPRDRKLLANAPYARVSIPTAYQRTIVQYHRKEAPGSIVIAFSTLLDTEFALALIDLRKRGHTVVAVDVLEGAPFEEERDQLVARMWSLQRSFMYRDMGTIGVDVVSWRGDATLDQAMQLVPDHRSPARRRAARLAVGEDREGIRL